MWEDRETSDVCEDYSYGGCVELQLLADCVRELEQQLCDLRIIWETEEDMEVAVR